MQYVPLTCNKDGTFSILGSTSQDAVDVHVARCTNKQYPELKKHVDEDKLCSDIGADGRTDDLQTSLHTVQIGWNMSAINSDLDFKEMVRSLTLLSFILYLPLYN